MCHRQIIVGVCCFSYNKNVLFFNLHQNAFEGAAEPERDELELSERKCKYRAREENFKRQETEQR